MKNKELNLGMILLDRKLNQWKVTNCFFGKIYELTECYALVKKHAKVRYVCSFELARKYRIK